MSCLVHSVIISSCFLMFTHVRRSNARIRERSTLYLEKQRLDGVSDFSNYKFRGGNGETPCGVLGSRSLGDERGKSYANMCRQCGRGYVEGVITSEGASRRGRSCRAERSTRKSAANVSIIASLVQDKNCVPWDASDFTCYVRMTLSRISAEHSVLINAGRRTIKEARECRDLRGGKLSEVTLDAIIFSGLIYGVAKIHLKRG